MTMSNTSWREKFLTCYSKIQRPLNRGRMRCADLSGWLKLRILVKIIVKYGMIKKVTCYIALLYIPSQHNSDILPKW